MGALFGRQRLWLGLLLLPALAFIAAWRLLPALYTVYLSFTSFNLAFDPGPVWVGARNYLHLLHDDKLLSSVGVTAEFSIAATLLELILGLGTAVLLDRRLPLRNLIMGICLVPMVLAPVTVATIWYVLLHDFVGPIPHLIRLMHGPEIGWFSTKWAALASIVIADVWEWTPLMTLLLLAALQGVSRETVEAAMADGASGVKVFRFVTLPQIAGMIAVAVGLRFVDAFVELDKVLIMTGGGPGTSTELVSVHIYRTAFQFFTLGYAATIVITLLLLLALIYWVYLGILSGHTLRESPT
jgi:multiple sugar transport system permease protein